MLVYPVPCPLGRYYLHSAHGHGHARTPPRAGFNHFPQPVAHAGQSTLISRQRGLNCLGLGRVNDIGVAVLNLLDELKPGQKPE